MDSALFVTSRGRSRRIEVLRMECDVRDIPRPVEAGTGIGEWRAGTAKLSGRLRHYNDGAIADPGDPSVTLGCCFLAVTDDRLLGILQPEDAEKATVWFATPRAAVKVSIEATSGLVNKQPKRIRLCGPTWEIDCSRVRRLTRGRGSRWVRDGAATSFVAALAGES